MVCFILQHPRVVYACCNAVGQMCTDFAPTMQKSFHEKIIVGMCRVLDDNDHPRVQVRSYFKYCCTEDIEHIFTDTVQTRNFE